MRRAGLVLLWWTVAVAAQADERILSFDAAIRVRADSTLEVTETLVVQAEGQQIRRGITRDFPTDYVDARGRRVVVGFDVLDVRRNGAAEPFRLERQRNGVRIWIGDADVLLPPAVHRYEIAYRSDRQLGFFDGHDELYWNVTGNGWSFPIDRATARVMLPAGVPPASLRLDAYTGSQGAKGQDWTASVEAGTALFSTTAPLAPHEGLTIVAGWPKGFVTAPGGLRQAGYQLRDAWPAYVGMTGLLLLLAYYLRAWWSVGRDPPARVPVPEYEAPAGLSPASLRYLDRMGYDDRCLAAAVLGLAVKEQLTIEQEPGGLLRGKGTFALARRDAPAAAVLPADEAVLLERLFKAGDVVELDDKNHALLGAARDAHRSALAAAHKPSGFRRNLGWHVAGIALSMLLIAVALVLPLGAGGFGPRWLLGTWPGYVAIGTVVLALLMNVLFGWLLKAPTLAGRALMDRIAGFKLYLDVAEGNDLRLLDEPPLTPELFERHLPAALALGVEQHWAERFASVFATQEPGYAPRWYHGDAWDAHRVARFSSGLGSSFSSAISSASSPPGSSSGGGGGGSSGGGGGGGGGGGW